MKLERISSNSTILNLMATLYCTHADTYWHSLRTANVAVHVATAIGSKDVDIDKVRDAALLHDIGKLKVPVRILNKEGTLTAMEIESIHCHPMWGEQILLSTKDTSLHQLSRYVREHHEQPNGSGYPRQLTLDRIHTISRIINIADRFAALTEDRPYRMALVPEVAINYLREDIWSFLDSHEAATVISMLLSFREGSESIVMAEVQEHYEVLSFAAAC